MARPFTEDENGTHTVMPCPDCSTYDDGEGIIDFCPLHKHAAALLNACLHMIDIVEDYERAHGIAGIDASLLHDAKVATLNAQGKVEEGYNDHTCDALCNSKSGCPKA